MRYAFARRTYTAHPLPEAPRLDATLTYTVVRSPISDPFARYSRYSALSIGS